MKQEFLYIDATPDESYPLRILQAYRRRGDYKWSTSSNDVAENNVLVKTMNELQEKRNDLLDRAIALLATLMGGKEKEAELHRLFILNRTHGEWFEPAQELLDFIDEVNNG